MAGSTTSRAPSAARVVPRLVGEISRNSEFRELRVDKLKGTLVDFNHLEHVLDNFAHIGTWQVELRKRHDDPLECDELILHAEKNDDFDADALREMLNARFLTELELHPNRIEFHSGGGNPAAPGRRHAAERAARGRSSPRQLDSCMTYGSQPNS